MKCSSSVTYRLNKNDWSFLFENEFVGDWCKASSFTNTMFIRFCDRKAMRATKTDAHKKHDMI